MGNCNRTYQLCNNNVATNSGSTTTKPELGHSTQLSTTTEYKHEASNSTTEPLEISHTMCTPATVTVCPTQTPSLMKADPPTHSPTGATDNNVNTSIKTIPTSCSIWNKATTITKTSTMVITTVLCTNNNDERKKECIDMTSIQAMGAVTGLLIVILAIMTTGYLYICWNMKKRGGIRSSLKQMAR